jgi:hypothetical protein
VLAADHLILHQTGLRAERTAAPGTADDPRP